MARPLKKNFLAASLRTLSLWSNNIIRLIQHLSFIAVQHLNVVLLELLFGRFFNNASPPIFL